MQLLPNTHTLCLTYDEFVQPLGLIPKGTYDSLNFRKNITVHGVGGNGRTVLIEIESLPPKYRAMVYEKYGDPYKYFAQQPILQLVVADNNAANFYATHELAPGRHLPLPSQQKYTRQAEWLNMILHVMEDKKTLKETLNITIEQFWENVIGLYKADKVENGLPESKRRLLDKVYAYKRDGYAGLIEKRFMNQNSRKVTPAIERLILALYNRHDKPYLKTVCLDYLKFMNGQLQVMDEETGELFNPQDFYHDGEPYLIGETTVDYYIKKPANLAAVDKSRLNSLQYATQYRPSVKRKAPVYAFSKITMDDIDLPFKTDSRNFDVKSYQIFDVASQAVIGVAFGRDKTTDLIREAMRDMMRLILRKGWGYPAEIEVERHLNWNLQGKQNDAGELEADILTAGAVFSFVRVCAGGNAKEKRAEHIIRVKKYQQQKKRPGFQARHYARLIANRLNKDKNTVQYHYEQIIQNELDDIATHNNELHPKQDLYPGLTRWQVLEQHQNPNLIKHATETVIPYIGVRRESSIRAGYIKVAGEVYRLPSIDSLNEFVTPMVVTYYLPDEQGSADTIYVYQDGNFICTAAKVEGFQEAKIEQTDADRENANEQWSYQTGFDKMVRERRDSLPQVVTFSGDAGQADAEMDAPAVEVYATNDTPNMQENATKQGGVMQKKDSSKQADISAEDMKSRAKRAL